MLEVDPVQLHLAGGMLAAAADDASTSLQATTGSDCGTGFPGTTAAAHSALVEAWQREDRVLLAALHSASTKLHQSADDYVRTDDRNAGDLLMRSPSATSMGGPPPRPLDL